MYHLYVERQKAPRYVCVQGADVAQTYIREWTATNGPITASTYETSAAYPVAFQSHTTVCTQCRAWHSSTRQSVCHGWRRPVPISTLWWSGARPRLSSFVSIYLHWGSKYCPGFVAIHDWCGASDHGAVDRSWQNSTLSLAAISNIIVIAAGRTNIAVHRSIPALSQF